MVQRSEAARRKRTSGPAASWFSRFRISFLIFALLVTCPWLPAPAASAREAEEGAEDGSYRETAPRLAGGGRYSLIWTASGPELGERSLVQQLEHELRGNGWSLASAWTWPLFVEGEEIAPDAREPRVQTQLSWRGNRRATGGSGAGAQWVSALRFRERPLSSRDPFYLFHPSSDHTWEYSASTAWEGKAAPGQGPLLARGAAWQLAAQWATGGDAGEGTGWLQARVEEDRLGQWRVTGAAFSHPSPGQWAWQVDGTRDMLGLRTSWGYARRGGTSGDPYRAAGFARIQVPRRGAWWGRLEVYRRDLGFRHRLGGTLPWPEGSTGIQLRAGTRFGQWELQWEGEAAGQGEHGAPSLRDILSSRIRTREWQQLTWRPRARWWARLERQVSWEGEGERYDVYVRWPRSQLAVRLRYDRRPPEGWSWRLDWNPGYARIRADWEQDGRGWRLEARREWPVVHLRMVYKERDDPGASPVRLRRQRQAFVEVGYRHAKGWELQASTGWDDLGRMDFHWNRPPRWQVEWTVRF